MLRSLVNSHSLLGRRRLDFGLLMLNLLHRVAQRFSKKGPMAIDLAQAGVSAARGNRDEAVDPLDTSAARVLILQLLDTGLA